MKGFQRIAATTLAAGLSLGLVACSPSGGTTTATTAPADQTAATTVADTMNIELTTAPVGLHPLTTNDSPSQYVNNEIYETLYRRSNDGTAYEPLLASDVPTYSEDGLTVTIPLREGVTFSDGTPFTSAAVGYMIDCLKDEAYGSQRPSIVGSIDSYECPDDLTIVLHLAYNDGVLLAKLSHTNGAIVNPELDKTQDFLVDPTGAGTGAYKFVSAITGSSYDLEARDDYWGGTPEVKYLHYDVIADEATAIARLQTGEADFYPTVASDSFSTAANIAGYTAVNQPSGAIQYMMLRSTEDTAVNPLMANVEFRTALIQAIDYPTYVQTVLADAASPAQSIVPPSLVGYTAAMEDSYIAYDAEAAKATIDANGWAGETVTLMVSTREAQQTLAAYVQDQLSKVGITVTVVSEEWATFLSDTKQPKAFDLSVMAWSNVTGDGQQMLEPNFSTTNGVRLMYNNADFDAFVQASAETTDLAERQENMLEAVQMIQGDAVVTPVSITNSLFVYNSTKFSDVTMGMGGEFYAKDFKVVK